jgi:hypothetical protein
VYSASLPEKLCSTLDDACDGATLRYEAFPTGFMLDVSPSSSIPEGKLSSFKEEEADSSFWSSESSPLSLSSLLLSEPYLFSINDVSSALDCASSSGDNAPEPVLSYNLLEMELSLSSVNAFKRDDITIIPHHEYGAKEVCHVGGPHSTRQMLKDR